MRQNVDFNIHIVHMSALHVTVFLSKKFLSLFQIHVKNWKFNVFHVYHQFEKP